jgi:hypothetical protein
MSPRKQANAHFFGIWSVYATERPDVIDPILGTEADLKALVTAFHDAGIKVFLDVVTHGVTFATGGQNDSAVGSVRPRSKSKLSPNPLISDHPEYFFHRGNVSRSSPAVGKWQMADFNYGSSSFTKWWVEVWMRYVTSFGVDGFRLDGPNGLSPSDQVLRGFDLVVKAAAAAGTPILVFAEENDYHFGEHDITADWKGGRAPTSPASFKPPATPGVNRANCYQSIMFSCHDGGACAPCVRAAKVAPLATSPRAGSGFSLAVDLSPWQWSRHVTAARLSRSVACLCVAMLAATPRVVGKPPRTQRKLDRTIKQLRLRLPYLCCLFAGTSTCPFAGTSTCPFAGTST